MRISVLLAGGHRVGRDRLRAALEREQDIDIVGEAGDGSAAVRLAGARAPDVVVMNADMPGTDGAEIIRQLRARAPDVKVIVLSEQADRRSVLNMFGTGAASYLLRDAAAEELSLAVRVVRAHQVYLSPAVTSLIVHDYLARCPAAPDSAASGLTPREREVLQLLAKGRSTKAIAELLCLSRKTIETHRAQLMEKLGIYSIASLTRYAIREGLTTI